MPGTSNGEWVQIQYQSGQDIALGVEMYSTSRSCWYILSLMGQQTTLFACGQAPEATTTTTSLCVDQKSERSNGLNSTPIKPWRHNNQLMSPYKTGFNGSTNVLVQRSFWLERMEEWNKHLTMSHNLWFSSFSPPSCSSRVTLCSQTRDHFS